MKVDLGDVDSRIKAAIHRVMASTFDRIEEATGREILVEDLTVTDYSISVAVTLKAREPEEKEAEKE